jgi:hypothetical protein
LVSIRLSRAIRDLANQALSGLITLEYGSHTRTKNNEVSRPLRYYSEPGSDVFSKDVVLDDRSEPSTAVFGRHERRKPIAEIEKLPGLLLVLIPRIRPAGYSPPRELTSSHVDTTLELTSKKICHGGFTRRLHSDHEPNPVRHVDHSVKQVSIGGCLRCRVGGGITSGRDSGSPAPSDFSWRFPSIALRRLPDLVKVSHGS